MSCPEPDVLIVGAGIAGASCAWTLAERGWRVQVLEARQPGHGASGNPAALLYPKLVAANDIDSNLQAQSYRLALQRLQAPPLRSSYRATGLLWLETDGKPLITSDHPWLGQDVWPLDAATASALAGLPINQTACWLPAAGLVDPAKLLATLLHHDQVVLHTQAEVVAVSSTADRWRVRTEDGRQWSAPHLVLAHAGAAKALPLASRLPLLPVRGQVSRLASPLIPACSISYGGYVAPLPGGELCLGATFQRGRDDASPTLADQQQNFDELKRHLPVLAEHLPPLAQWRARAAIRWQTPDYLPLAGPLPDLAALEDFCRHTPWGRHPQRPAIPARHTLQVSLAHGAKGFSQAWLAAELIADNLEGRPPASSGPDWQEMLRPDRFLLRAWRRGRLS